MKVKVSEEYGTVYATGDVKEAGALQKAGFHRTARAWKWELKGSDHRSYQAEMDALADEDIYDTEAALRVIPKFPGIIAAFGAAIAAGGVPEGKLAEALAEGREKS